MALDWAPVGYFGRGYEITLAVSELSSLLDVDACNADLFSFGRCLLSFFNLRVGLTSQTLQHARCSL